ncbi:MAG: hypothetical protein GY702_23025 [Desulfobulbaceae bacterium]|nr:hypothetical protein [Desulfobulbaceae bacterium]
MYNLAQKGLFLSWMGGWRKGVIFPVFFAVGICNLMFTGLAGEEKIEMYLCSALVLWLLHLSLHCYIASRLLKKTTGKNSLLGLAVSIVSLVLSGSLVVTSGYFGEIVKSIFLLLFIVFVLVYIWAGLEDKKTCLFT